jgi:hypothetical protein
MKTLYKITNQYNKTHNNTLWGPGVKHTATGKDYYLCSDGLIHAYEDPLLAMFLYPIHVTFQNLKLWEAKTTCKKIVSDGAKVGVKSLTTLHEIPLPVVTLTQRVAFAILCAKKVCSDIRWYNWADKWLSGEDRRIESAHVASAAYPAVDAAYYAANAAYYASYYAANAANGAAKAAEYGARAASYANDSYYAMNLKKIVKKAMRY